MRTALASLRVRLALLGFVAIYAPVLLVFGVGVATEVETRMGADAAPTVDRTSRQSPFMWTVLALGPVTAGLAWWWAGRAVRPIDRVRTAAEDIEATDLSRRIGLRRGPTELVALAASFDAMLARLDAAAETQRRLIEEASHELRIPLAVLMSNAEVLLAHPRPTLEVYRTGLERTRTAAVRLQTTIDELLVDARGRARRMTRAPADVAALVRDVVADAAVLAETKGIRLTAPAGPSPAARCPVDEPTVRRAIANLVDNAIRYAPAGSAVDAAVETADDMVAVVVTDHGSGIPPEQQDRVFQRFWRGRGDTRGTGLGLPIANQVALAHGGELTLRSPGPAGDGCVFRLTLRR
ncbi:HAMP domain-containing histidine kinase [Dactylosporangium sp. NBC_01737]|uniref:HAMP domain-containing sensor histidine kinase n=1 Tax=Dactylosporangium sp. NBC_01737 TaxID=2975959 RepID=UPI002E163BAE|nr:HAMP domain-containing histidine kinase [Dactylosporangium sp. NBC_01737]